MRTRKKSKPYGFGVWGMWFHRVVAVCLNNALRQKSVVVHGVLHGMMGSKERVFGDLDSARGNFKLFGLIY